MPPLRRARGTGSVGVVHPEHVEHVVAFGLVADEEGGTPWHLKHHVDELGPKGVANDGIACAPEAPLEGDELPVDDALVVSFAVQVEAPPPVVAFLARGFEGALVRVVEEIQLADVGVDLGLLFLCPSSMFGDPEVGQFSHWHEAK